ncbi:MAG: helix-hairpin-helix domain-containing protein [Burkholderiaceae bacterium]|nr:helix-hairpin-helix domain-containing protein [Burkholderiaceae bacterium]
MSNSPCQLFRLFRLHLLQRLLPLLFLPFMVDAWAVDVNQASAQALQSISGIGPKMAERIVTERARGPFESLEHLGERVSGLGAKRLKRFKAAGLTVGLESRSVGQSSSNGVGMHTVQSSALKSNQVPKRAARPTRLSKTQASSITPEIWLIDNAPSNP